MYSISPNPAGNRFSESPWLRRSYARTSGEKKGGAATSETVISKSHPMLWICYGYVMDTAIDMFSWQVCPLHSERFEKKKNICQAPGVVSCIVQDLVQFHLDIPNSHRLQASPEPIAMWVNRPWFGAYVSNIWVVEMGVPRVLIDFRLASSMK